MADRIRLMLALFNAAAALAFFLGVVAAMVTRDLKLAGLVMCGAAVVLLADFMAYGYAEIVEFFERQNRQAKDAARTTQQKAPA